MAVRNESVRLSLDDAGFTTGLAKAAAASKLLDGALNDLDGSNIGTASGLRGTARDIDALGTSVRRNGTDLDSFTSRLGLLASAVGAIAPGLIPIGAVAVPAVTGLASQLGFAAIGAGSLLTAVQGVGDALSAVNDAALEPTAANLDKAREAMSRLGPEAQEFVTRFQEIRPVLQDMRDSAAAGWFPGLTESLDNLVEVGPRVGEILRVIGEAGGNLLAEGADALAGPQWDEFLTFVQNTAPAALDTLGRTIGNVALGLAELWQAFAPLNADFGSFMLDASRGFAAWADGLAETQGFKDFVEYLRKSGPQVADALGSIGSAGVELVQAFAPLGGGVLRTISALADAIGAIADSPIGPPLAALVTAMSAIRLAGAAGSGISAFAASLTGIKPAADGARLSLLDLSKQMTIVAGAAYSAKIGFDVIDSYNRYKEASDVTVASVGELATALGDSNVGAAAEDFGIDLQRLAEDLVENGEKGDYYREVLGRMAEANKGFGGTLSGVTDLMGPWIGDTERAQQAQADLANIVENNGDLLGAGLAGGLADAGSAAAIFGANIRSAAGGIQAFSDSFRDLSALLSDRATLRAYEESLDQLNASVKENGDNWDASGAKGRANLEAMDRLVADAITRSDTLFAKGRELASQGMLTRALDDLREFRRENPKAADSLKPLFQELRRIHDQRVKPKLDLDTGAFKTAANAVSNQLGALDKRTAKPKVTLEGAGTALGLISSIMGQLNSVDGRVATATVHINRTGSDITAPGVATGGYITGPGTSTSDSIPAMLSTGEFVMNAKAVQYYGLDAMFRMNARHLAGGGPATVGGGPTTRGLGTAASLDINPFAASLHNLTQIAAREYDSRELQLDRTDAQFARILEKRAERAKKEADADKGRLDAMLETQRAFEEQVAGLFKSDVFERGETQWIARFPDGSIMELGSDVDSISGETGAYLAQAGATITQQSGFDPVGGLQTDVANMREAMRLYQELRQRGFDGPAFRDLAANADVATLQEMVAMSTSELRQIERLYEQRDQLAGNLGNQVGKDFGGEIRELRQDYKQSLEIARRMENRAEQTNHKLDAVNQRLTSMEATLPPRTGQAVGAAVGGALAGATRDGEKGR